MTKAFLVAVVLAACGGSEGGDPVDPTGTYTITCEDCDPRFAPYLFGSSVVVDANSITLSLSNDGGAHTVNVATDCDDADCLMTAESGFVVEVSDAAGPLGTYAITDVALTVPEGCGGMGSFAYECVGWFDNTQCNGTVTFQISCND